MFFHQGPEALSVAAVAKMAHLVEHGHVYQVFRQRGAHVAEIQSLLHGIADSPLALRTVHTEGGNIHSDSGAPVRHTLRKDIHHRFNIQGPYLFLHCFDVLVLGRHYDFVINYIIMGFLSVDNDKGLLLSQVRYEITCGIGMVGHLLHMLGYPFRTPAHEVVDLHVGGIERTAYDDLAGGTDADPEVALVGVASERVADSGGGSLRFHGPIIYD